jgi:hypothetical protein
VPRPYKSISCSDSSILQVLFQYHVQSCQRHADVLLSVGQDSLFSKADCLEVKSQLLMQFPMDLHNSHQAHSPMQHQHFQPPGV